VPFKARLNTRTPPDSFASFGCGTFGMFPGIKFGMGVNGVSDIISYKRLQAMVCIPREANKLRSSKRMKHLHPTRCKRVAVHSCGERNTPRGTVRGIFNVD